MFHTPEPRGGKRAQRRRMMQLVGIRNEDVFDDEDETLHKFTGKPRRAALAPFSQDERFAETRMYQHSLANMLRTGNMGVLQIARDSCICLQNKKPVSYTHLTLPTIYSV